MPAPTSSPIPTAAHQAAPVALTAASAAACSPTSRTSPIPAYRRGRRHPLAGVLAIAAGARSLAAIGEWAADAPAPVLAALGVRRDLLTGAFTPPAEATVRHVLACIDPAALDQVIGRWLADQPPPARPEPPATGRPQRAVAVDGRTLRGSGHPATAPPHLLAAMDHASGVVLGQTEVDPTTNEITQFQPLLDPLGVQSR